MILKCYCKPKTTKYFYFHIGISRTLEFLNNLLNDHGVTPIRAGMMGNRL